MFDVSTDYLLKDEMTAESGNPISLTDADEVSEECLRSVSLEEANGYLELVEKTAKKIAAGVSACILSPVLLFLLSGIAEHGILPLTEDMAAGIGVSILLLTVAGAVGFRWKRSKRSYRKTETSL